MIPHLIYIQENFQIIMITMTSKVLLCANFYSIIINSTVKKFTSRYCLLSCITSRKKLHPFVNLNVFILDTVLLLEC